MSETLKIQDLSKICLTGALKTAFELMFVIYLSLELSRINVCHYFVFTITQVTWLKKFTVFILPTVEDISQRLTGATIFSTLDCSSSFWPLPLDQASARLTTFVTPVGQYYFNRMPYGLSSATENFQKKLYELLPNIKGDMVDIDDILIFGKDKAEHDENLTKVLRLLQELFRV